MMMQHSTKYKRRRVSAPLVGLAVMAGGIVAPLLVAVQPAYAASSRLYLAPASASVTVNTTFTVAVRMNASEPINAVEANLTYNASQLEFVSINDSGSAFGINASSGGGGGSISINRGQIGGASGDQLVANIVFKAVAANVTSSVNFNGNSQLLRNSDSSNALQGTSGGTYTLKAAGAATPAPTAKTPTPSPSRVMSPTPTTPTPSPSTTPTPAEQSPSPAPPATVSPQSRQIEESPSNSKAAVLGVSGLAVLVIAAVGAILFFRHRGTKTLPPGIITGDSQATVFGPSQSVQPTPSVQPANIDTANVTSGPTVISPSAPVSDSVAPSTPAVQNSAPANVIKPEVPVPEATVERPPQMNISENSPVDNAPKQPPSSGAP